MRMVVRSNRRQRQIQIEDGTLDEAEKLGTSVGEELISQGAMDFEKEWREKYGVW